MKCFCEITQLLTRPYKYKPKQRRQDSTMKKSERRNQISLQLIENGDNVNVILDQDGDTIFRLNNATYKEPRVVGFRAPQMSEPAMLQRATDESENDGVAGMIRFLSEVNRSMDHEIDRHIKTIRTEIRKILMCAKTKKSANEFRAKLPKQSDALFPENPASKIPRPGAKCPSCNYFYPDSRNNSQCDNCEDYIKRESRPNTWFECQACHGTGYNFRLKKICTSCEEKGWLFANLFKI